MMIKGGIDSNMDDERAKFAELEKLIADHKDQPGALMPVLQGAQGIFGCVSEDVQKVIAEGLGVTLAEVYGVATFYAQFSLHPKGKYLINVCLGTACYVKGSQSILDKLSKLLDIPVGGTTPDGMFTLETVACLGACGLAPVMTIDGEVHSKMTPESAVALINDIRAKEAKA